MSDVAELTELNFKEEDEVPRPAFVDEGRPFSAHLILSVMVLACGALAKASDEASDAGSLFTFPAMCALVILYALLQLALLRRFQPSHWVINPAVQSALFVHLVPTVSVLILAVLPYELQESVGFGAATDQWAVQYEWLNLIGAVALWTGYWSGLANGLAKLLVHSRFLERVLRPGVALNNAGVIGLVIIACSVRLLAVSLGVYGYSSSYDTLIAAGGYSEYIFIASALGRVALVAVSLVYFQSGAGAWLVIGLLVVETAFGVLSGFKSAVVLPVIIVGMSYYAQRGKIPRWLLPVAISGIFVAYALIEPFRTARNEETSFDGTSLFSIIDTFSASRDPTYMKVEPDGALTTTVVTFLARGNDVGSAVPGIEYAARTEVLPQGSPQFLEDILFSPFYSIVPRILWDGKPMNDLGLWYTRVVMGTGTMSSTAMYPVTYLNFAGGAVAVFLGFLAVGVIQSMLFRGLLAHGGSAVFVVVCMFGFLGHIDSLYYSFFISVFRNIPMLLAIQWVVFLPGPRRHAA